MRCLTLADRLADEEAEIMFAVRGGGVETVPLLAKSRHELLVLECPVEDEAQEICERVGACDWLIVDHYERDEVFERESRMYADHIFVIDDIADRKHDCDILLDQSLGRKAADYAGLVPDNARLLISPKYALLRPEFARQRPWALERRQKGGPVRRILVSLGASDPGGVTGRALQAIGKTSLDLTVDVAIGAADPVASGLAGIAETIPQQVNFYGFEANIAQLMLDADLAIGAGGSSSWERCSLGLPAILIVTAENQILQTQLLLKKKAALFAGNIQSLTIEKLAQCLWEVYHNDELRREIAEASFTLIDASGTERVASLMLHQLGLDKL